MRSERAVRDDAHEPAGGLLALALVLEVGGEEHVGHGGEVDRGRQGAHAELARGRRAGRGAHERHAQDAAPGTQRRSGEDARGGAPRGRPGVAVAEVLHPGADVGSRLQPGGLVVGERAAGGEEASEDPFAREHDGPGAGEGDEGGTLEPAQAGELPADGLRPRCRGARRGHAPEEVCDGCPLFQGREGVVPGGLAAEVGLHAGDELVEDDGLRDVVVRARLEAAHDVVALGLPGDEDDGQRAGLRAPP